MKSGDEESEVKRKTRSSINFMWFLIYIKKELLTVNKNNLDQYVKKKLKKNVKNIYTAILLAKLLSDAFKIFNMLYCVIYFNCCVLMHHFLSCLM